MSVELIMNLGSDQMANQFVFSLPTGIPGGGNKEAVALRLDGSFDTPAFSLATYDVNYRGIKVTKVSTKEETEKTFSCEFRLDQQWEVYDSLVNWLKMVFDPDTLTGYPEEAIRTTALVQAYGRNNEIVKSIRFTGVVIKSLKISEFSQESSDPNKLTAEFAFAGMKVS